MFLPIEFSSTLLRDIFGTRFEISEAVPNMPRICSEADMVLLKDSGISQRKVFIEESLSLPKAILSRMKPKQEYEYAYLDASYTGVYLSLN